MSVAGADTDALDRAARRFAEGSERLRVSASNLDRAAWALGPRFAAQRAQATREAARLRARAGHFNDLAWELRRNAEDQRRTSNSDGGGGLLAPRTRLARAASGNGSLAPSLRGPLLGSLYSAALQRTHDTSTKVNDWSKFEIKFSRIVFPIRPNPLYLDRLRNFDIRSLRSSFRERAATGASLLRFKKLRSLTNVGFLSGLAGMSSVSRSAPAGPVLVSSSTMTVEGGIGAAVDVGKTKVIRVDRYSDGSAVVVDLNTSSAGVGAGASAQAHIFDHRIGGSATAGAKAVFSSSDEYYFKPGESVDSAFLAIAAKSAASAATSAVAASPILRGVLASGLRHLDKPESQTTTLGGEGSLSALQTTVESGLETTGLDLKASTLSGVKRYANGDFGFLFSRKESGQAWLPGTGGIDADAQVDGEILTGSTGTQLRTVTTYGTGDQRHRIESVVPIDGDLAKLRNALDARHPSRIADVVRSARDDASVRVSTYTVSGNSIGADVSAGVLAKLGGNGQISWSSMTLNDPEKARGPSGTW